MEGRNDYHNEEQQVTVFGGHWLVLMSTVESSCRTDVT